MLNAQSLHHAPLGRARAILLPHQQSFPSLPLPSHTAAQTMFHLSENLRFRCDAVHGHAALPAMPHVDRDATCSACPAPFARQESLSVSEASSPQKGRHHQGLSCVPSVAPLPCSALQNHVATPTRHRASRVFAAQKSCSHMLPCPA